MIPQVSLLPQGCGSDTAEKIPPPDGRGSFRLLYIRSAPPAHCFFSCIPPPLLNVCLIDWFFACPLGYFSPSSPRPYAVIKEHRKTLSKSHSTYNDKKSRFVAPSQKINIFYVPSTLLSMSCSFGQYEVFKVRWLRRNQDQRRGHFASEKVPSNNHDKMSRL